MRLGWLCGLLAGLVPVAGHAANPSALWEIVSQKCVPHEQTARNPSPCTSVNLSQGTEKGYVVLKDLNGVAQFLLIPTERIGGIEDLRLLSPNTTNYWDAAWRARYYVEGRLHTNLARDGFALALNSSVGRTQDQLHIHIDCIRPDVRDLLRTYLGAIGTTWTPFPVPLSGGSYQAIRINQESLEGINPFTVLANADTRAAVEMGHHTLALVGEHFADDTDGFVLLDQRADPAAGNPGSAELLEDHACAIAQK